MKEDRQSTRRNFMKSIGVASTASLAGCSGVLEANDEPSEDSTQGNSYADESSRFDSGDNADDLDQGQCYDVDVKTGKSYAIQSSEEYEFTVEGVAVSENRDAAIKVNGHMESVEAGDEFTVNGDQYNVDGVIRTGENEGVIELEYGENC